MNRQADSGEIAVVEAQARQALRLVLDRIGAATRPNRILADPRTCPNCGEPADSLKSPYCSEACREMAGLVRQVRAGRKLGWIELPDKQVALGQVLWHILGGGRPLRSAIAPRRAIEKAIDRAQGRCEVCGEPATTVDHPWSGCNRPTNLRAVCATCCRDRPFGDPELLASPAAQATLDEMAMRIGAEIPVRVCDDPDEWDWRAYIAQRRNAAEG